jgi:DNA polymerase III epsilon subunit-like protein
MRGSVSRKPERINAVMKNTQLHPPGDLSIALGCVVHDALILAIAISMLRSRHSRPKIEGLNWSEAQIAIDVILLKSRVLEDFVFSKGSSDDILAKQFGYKPSRTHGALPKAFRTAINKRSAHLSWTRVAASLPEMTKVEEGLDIYAEKILAEIYSFVESAIKQGVTPSLDRHKRYWEALQREYAKLATSHPGKGSRGSA